MSQIQVYFPGACHAVNCKPSYFRAIISRHTSALPTYSGHLVVILILIIHKNPLANQFA